MGQKKIKSRRVVRYYAKAGIKALTYYSDRQRSTEDICKSVVQNLVNTVVKRNQNSRTGPQCKAFCDVEDCPNRNSTKNVMFHYFPKPQTEWVTITNEHGVSEIVDRAVAWEKALQMDTSKAAQDFKARRLRVCFKHFLKTDYTRWGNPRQELRKTAIPFLRYPPKPIITQDLEEDVPDYVVIHKVKLKNEPEEEPINEINEDTNNEIKEELIHEIKEESFDIEMEELDVKEEVIPDPIRELPPETRTPEPELSTRIPDADPLITSPIPELKPPTRNINPEPELLIRNEIPELEPPARNRTPVQELSTRTNVPILEPILLWPTATEIPEALGPKIDTRCAICLSNQSCHNIHEIQNGITILKMLELCTGYKMEMQEQTLMPGICDICYKELLISNNLREKFLKSQNTLKSERNEIACSNSEKAILSDTANYTPAVVSPKSVIQPREEIRMEVCLESDANIEKNICTPLECFENIMGAVLDKITEYTNQTIRRQAKSAFSFSGTTCIEELRALIGILVYSGSVKRVNMNKKELYSSTFSGTMYESAIGCQRFNFLMEQLTFYGTRSYGKAKRKILESDGFTHFMDDIWIFFMDKCSHLWTNAAEYSTSSVTKIEHCLVCNSQCPVQRFRLENSSSSGIKMVTYFDSTNRFLIKSYPFTGKDSQQPVQNVCNPEMRCNFEQLWSNFNCSQNSTRWSMILFYSMLNIALINSYSVHCSRSVDVKLSEEVFLKRLANSLIMPWAEKIISLDQRNGKYRCYQSGKRKGI